MTPPQENEFPTRRRRPPSESGTSRDLAVYEEDKMPAVPGDATAATNVHVPGQPAAPRDESIGIGQVFKRPEEEFPQWDTIFMTVQSEFISNSGKIGGGSEALKEEGPYLELVGRTVNQHPEWAIAPVSLPRLVELLRTYQFGYGRLQDYMNEEGLEELYFNRYDQGFYIIKGKKLKIKEQVFADNKELMTFIDGVARANGLEINLSRPSLDATLSDGSRLNATMDPIAVDGPDFTIRKHREIPFTIDQLITTGMMTPEVARDLESWTRGGANIVVSGGTGSGKTSLLNTLGNAFIPRDARVIILENRKELQIYTEDTKYLQTREDATRELESDIGMESLIKQCLRKRPDRIIVGEVRGPEAYYALTAWNSGHDGSFCTVHANNAASAVNKLEQLASGAGELDQEGIRSLIADAVDFIVQVQRYAGDGARKITEVIQVLHQFKFDQHNPEVMAQVQELNKNKQLRAIRNEILILPIYSEDRVTGQLVKVNNPIPVQGKNIR